jgi:hypothetical protein
MDRGGEHSGIVRCSLDGVNPALHPGIFGNPAVAASYGFVRSRDGTWHVQPNCRRIARYCVCLRKNCAKCDAHHTAVAAMIALAAQENPPLRLSEAPRCEGGLRLAKHDRNWAVSLTVGLGAAPHWPKMPPDTGRRPALPGARYRSPRASQGADPRATGRTKRNPPRLRRRRSALSPRALTLAAHMLAGGLNTAAKLGASCAYLATGQSKFIAGHGTSELHQYRPGEFGAAWQINH